MLNLDTGKQGIKNRKMRYLKIILYLKSIEQFWDDMPYQVIRIENYWSAYFHLNQEGEYEPSFEKK